MSLKRYGAKRDKSEQAIIESLRAVGAIVHIMSGEGIPDLLVCYRATTFLLEVKTGKGKLTPAQQLFMDTWQDDNVAIVRSEAEALHFIGAIDIITDR